ncbi:hypothetical protein GS528_07290 [Rhodococcus hoagii]|nr:hypothetical protein [Prescottella equi]
MGGRISGFNCGAPNFDRPRPEYPSPVTSREEVARYHEAESEWANLHQEHIARSLDGEFCNLDALEVEWRQIAQESAEAARQQDIRFAEAQGLPLIVLAGLR